jgi:general secretion pathway protein A
MYTQHFRLREPPFNVTPDPRFLYLNDCYQEAIAALGYGIEARKGFVALVGEAGTGKTTLLRRVLDTLDPRVRTVLLLHPTVGFDEILEYILQELGIPLEGAGKLTRLQRLNEFLLEHTRSGGNVALLIDEAQDLAPGVLRSCGCCRTWRPGGRRSCRSCWPGSPS